MKKEVYIVNSSEKAMLFISAEVSLFL